MELTLCCIWAAYTTTELPEVATSTVVSPEVAADAAEPLGVMTLTAVFSEAMQPSNALSACLVVVKETVTAVKPPEVAATTAEPSEVSVVSTHKISACPVTLWRLPMNPRSVTAIEAVCEPSSCPVTAMEAAYEPSSCPVTAMEAAYEPSSCPVTTMKAACELSACPVKAMESVSELLPCSEPANEAISELSSCSESTLEAHWDWSL